MTPFLLDGNNYTLHSCRFANGDVVMGSDLFDVGIHGVTVEAGCTENSHVYDLQGRRVTDQPRRGIYIQNGRKRIVK